MHTTQNTKSNQPPVEAKPSKTKDVNIDALKHPEMLQQLIDEIKPVIEFQKAAEKAAMDDVTICWDVRAIRGKDTVFARTKGSSTLNMILAENTMMDAMPIVEEELKNKIISPMVGAFQDLVNRVALEELAAKDAALDLDDLSDDDLC